VCSKSDSIPNDISLLHKSVPIVSHEISFANIIIAIDVDDLESWGTVSTDSDIICGFVLFSSNTPRVPVRGRKVEDLFLQILVVVQVEHVNFIADYCSSESIPILCRNSLIGYQTRFVGSSSVGTVSVR